MNEITSLVFSIIGACTGIVGMLVAIWGIIHNRYLAVHNYLSGIDDPKLIAARAAVYQNKDTDALDNQDTSAVINFFHHWGLLARKHYLPLWVFDSGSGAGVLRLYELTKSHIEAKRNKYDDPTYAANFEWLYITLSKRYIKKKRFW